MDALARGVTSATTRAVIVRACTGCGGKRQIGQPCAGCGNPEAPVTHDLGIQSATYRNPLKHAMWLAVGQRLAARRARQANLEA